MIPFHIHPSRNLEADGSPESECFATALHVGQNIHCGLRGDGIGVVRF
jgi:hypothetical protein